MNDQSTREDAAEATRIAKWDRFLDAYSLYLGEPNLANAASLKLAGADLEQSDDAFSLDTFVDKLGWQEEEECKV